MPDDVGMEIGVISLYSTLQKPQQRETPRQQRGRQYGSKRTNYKKKKDISRDVFVCSGACCSHPGARGEALKVKAKPGRGEALRVGMRGVCRRVSVRVFLSTHVHICQITSAFTFKIL